MGPVEQSMRNHLADSLDGHEPLDQFADWIVGAVWNIEQAGEPSAATLGYTIELVLAEWTSGLLDAAERDAGLHTLFAAGAWSDEQLGSFQRTTA